MTRTARVRVGKDGCLTVESQTQQNLVLVQGPPARFRGRAVAVAVAVDSGQGQGQWTLHWTPDSTVDSTEVIDRFHSVTVPVPHFGVSIGPYREKGAISFGGKIRPTRGSNVRRGGMV